MEEYAFYSKEHLSVRDMSLAKEIVRCYTEKRKAHRRTKYIVASNNEFVYYDEGEAIFFNEEQFRKVVAVLLATELLNVQTMRQELIFDGILVDVPLNKTSYFLIKSTSAAITYDKNHPDIEILAFADEVKKKRK